MSRKIGVNWGCYGPIAIDEQIDLIKRNGFEATFTGSENGKLEEIMHALKAAGIVCDNYHAPFNKINDIWAAGEAGEDMLNRLLVSVEKCVKYDVPALVVHLSSGLKPPYVNEIGYERWSRLMELADKNGVTICYENQRMLSNLAFAFEQFPTARFCWDLGHEACFTPGRRYMPMFGKYLSALHIHDNHGVFNADEHMLPFDASIDYEYCADQIAQTGYTGTVMLEIIRKNSTFYPETPAEEYYSRAGDAARKFAAMIDAAAEKYAK